VEFQVVLESEEGVIKCVEGRERETGPRQWEERGVKGGEMGK
jgi:hypothetical protein